MSITVQQLIACGVAPTQARIYASPLGGVLIDHGISSTEERAAVIAQCMHESGNFTSLEESLYYSKPENIVRAFKRLAHLSPPELVALTKNPHALADAAYGRVNGNRGPLSGDGWTYRGSGLIQLTGLANFERAAKLSGRPYVDQPDLVRKNPLDACITAVLFWEWSGCRTAMAENDFDGTSKIINLGSRTSKGTPNGNEERRRLYTQVLEALA